MLYAQNETHPSSITTPYLSVDLARAAERSESFPKDWTPERTRRAIEGYVKF
jgi:hypothetical protein